MKSQALYIFLVGLLMCLVVIGLTPVKRIAAQSSTGTTTRVSVDSSGAQGNEGSNNPSISADGRFVAFSSSASNLVLGDTNDWRDIFVHDRQTRVTTRISVDSSGAQGNNESGSPSISADGRFVAFVSEASNLVPSDTNDWEDIFVHDRQTGITTRVSVDSLGAQGNNNSRFPSISADGRFVAFVSRASNLIPSDTNYDKEDVFVHDRQTRSTILVSVDSSGVQGSGPSEYPSISANGRFVAFVSWVSNDGPDNAYEEADIFVHDRQTGATALVSVDSSGAVGNDQSYKPSISADGRFVAFESKASNLVPSDTNDWEDIFVHDRQTGVTTRVSVDSLGAQGNQWPTDPVISADERFVVFESAAYNLDPNDNANSVDVFVHDRQTGVTTLVSVGSSDPQGNDRSGTPSISADGRFVVFQSDAPLVSGDTNDSNDIFVHDRSHSDEISHPDSTITAVEVTQPASTVGDRGIQPAGDLTTAPDPTITAEPTSTAASSRAGSGSNGILIGIIIVLAAALLFMIIGNLTRRR